MKILWLIIELAATVFEFYVTINLLNNVMESRYKGIKRSLLSVSFIAILALYITFINSMYVFEGWLSLITVLITVIYTFIALKGSVFLRITVPVISFSIMLLINISVTYILSLIFGMSSSFIFSENNSTRLIAIFFTKLLYFVAANLLKHLFTKKSINLKNRELFISFTMSTLTFLVAISLVKVQIDIKNENWQLAASIASLLAMDVFIIYMMKRVSDENKNKIKISILELQLSEQKKMIEDAGSISAEIKKANHDLKHHLLCVMGIIENGDIDSAHSYLKRMIHEYENNVFKYIYIDNSAVNSILNFKIGRCHTNGIDIKAEIETDFSGFDDLDLCVLIANLLDNAIEASIHLKKPQIIVTIKNEKNYLCINVKNRIDISVLDTNKELKTTKKDTSKHGLGMYSVSEIVEKYDGMKSYYEKNGYFVVDIWLKRNTFSLPERIKEEAICQTRQK